MIGRRVGAVDRLDALPGLRARLELEPEPDESSSSSPHAATTMPSARHGQQRQQGGECVSRVSMLLLSDGKARRAAAVRPRSASLSPSGVTARCERGEQRLGGEGERARRRSHARELARRRRRRSRLMIGVAERVDADQRRDRRRGDHADTATMRMPPKISRQRERQLDLAHDLRVRSCPSPRAASTVVAGRRCRMPTYGVGEDRRDRQQRRARRTTLREADAAGSAMKNATSAERRAPRGRRSRCSTVRNW